MFFFKNKEIIVDAFTRNEDVEKQYPIKLAANFVPDWWKNTDKSYIEDDLYPMPTIRTCPGILDLYKKGFMVPLWSDIAFKVTKDGYKWQAADRITELSVHDSIQWNKFADDTKFGHIKISSEWAIRTKSNVDWMFMEPYWNIGVDRNYTISPGVINAYYSNMPLNVQILIKKEEYRFNLIAGEPIAHLVPLSDNKIKIVTHTVDEKDWVKYNSINKSKFVNNYNTTTKKCPFHR